MVKFENAKHKDTFLMQIPYLNSAGNARVVEITHSSADQLVKAGTHKVYWVGWLNQKQGVSHWLLTPKVPAVVGHQFQVGFDPV